ncbi:MAG: transcriptional regulator [Bacteroidetes bacterium RIFCSPLOWO2_12_FULL_31_6]|nr:MAG: transcriptional regulator [Bacteroidetes bacterium RIFCSPLOWO2_12_FULL_31_6]
MKNILLPKSQRILTELGSNIKLARLRRKMTSNQVAERANIARTTLFSIEKGSKTVSIGSYLSILQVLSLEKDLLLVGKDDVLGRKLQDAKLVVKKRAPKRKQS